jgi:hypothetical protein
MGFNPTESLAMAAIFPPRASPRRPAALDRRLEQSPPRPFQAD